MLSHFLSRDMRCVLIASSNSHRQLLWSVLKELGFNAVVTLADIKSAVKIMETEKVDWVITPLVDDKDNHVLALLELINSLPALRDTFVSIMCDQDDELLPAAFAAGALSCHKRESSRDAYQHEFNTLLTRIADAHDDNVVVAASYLGDVLLAAAKYDEWKNLTGKIKQRVESHEYLRILQATALLSTGNTAQGLAILYQILLTTLVYRDRVTQTIATHFGQIPPPHRTRFYQSNTVISPSSWLTTTAKKPN